MIDTLSPARSSLVLQMLASLKHNESDAESKVLASAGLATLDNLRVLASLLTPDVDEVVVEGAVYADDELVDSEAVVLADGGVGFAMPDGFGPPAGRRWSLKLFDGVEVELEFYPDPEFGDAYVVSQPDIFYAALLAHRA